MQLSTQVVHRVALAKLTKDPNVRAQLGSNLRSGMLRAYVVNPGHLSVGSKKLGWVEPRASMLFQVVGDKGEGMATVEAVKHRGGIVLTAVAVDTLASAGKPSQLLIVVGSEEKLAVRGTLRGFLQTERAQYIPQQRAETDDDRLAEQESLPEPPPEEEAASAATEEAPAQGGASAAGGSEGGRR